MIDCTPETQRQRVMQRSGLAAEEVDRIIAQQARRAERLACADAVIFNEGLSLSQLRQQVHKLADHFGL